MTSDKKPHVSEPTADTAPNARASAALTEQLLAALNATEDAAAIALFFKILRHTPGLRQWLRIVHREPSLLSRFDACITGQIQPPLHRTGYRLLAWLASDDPTTLDEIDNREHEASTHARRYGGLTRPQVLRYIRHYQAGTIALAPFLTALAWRHANPEKPPSGKLLHIAELFFQAGITNDNPQLIRHLAKAADFFHRQPVGSFSRQHFGYPHWWKLVLFHYMLNHPKPCYRVREFQQYLAVHRLPIESKDLRRFCQKHHIVRDSRPGRPRYIAPA